MRRVLLSVLLVSGCATVQTGGAYTNPRLDDVHVDGPAVLLQPLACEGRGVMEGSATEAQEKLRWQLALRVAAPELETASSTAELLCSDLASDRALFADAFLGTSWKVSDASTSAIRQLAVARGVTAVWVPVVRPRPACERSTPPTDRSNARPPDPLTFDEECASKTVDVGLFLFNADGTLAWKALGTADGRSGSVVASLDRVSERLVAELPRQNPGTALVKDQPGAEP